MAAVVTNTCGIVPTKQTGAGKRGWAVTMGILTARSGKGELDFVNEEFTTEAQSPTKVTKPNTRKTEKESLDTKKSALAFTPDRS